ncbi:hypothetical protein Ahy_B03g064305 [Arachis hypogaea]|uniref:Uncharacterized protein n=1 Tax=Arachis hypogaea TaxID=3818 RepID=A0A444ZZB5_ARAHY|nr:hypothetical protein Ahy_B03g064305 [Arachis hypogaea]
MQKLFIPLAVLLHEGQKFNLAKLLLCNLYDELGQMVESLRKRTSISAGGPFGYFSFGSMPYSKNTRNKEESRVLINKNIEGFQLVTLQPDFENARSTDKLFLGSILEISLMQRFLKRGPAMSRIIDFVTKFFIEWWNNYYSQYDRSLDHIMKKAIKTFPDPSKEKADAPLQQPTSTSVAKAVSDKKRMHHSSSSSSGNVISHYLSTSQEVQQPNQHITKEATALVENIDPPIIEEHIIDYSKISTNLTWVKISSYSINQPGQSSQYDLEIKEVPLDTVSNPQMLI